MRPCQRHILRLCQCQILRPSHRPLCVHLRARVHFSASFRYLSDKPRTFTILMINNKLAKFYFSSINIQKCTRDPSPQTAHIMTFNQMTFPTLMTYNLMTYNLMTSLTLLQLQIPKILLKCMEKPPLWPKVWLTKVPSLSIVLPRGEFIVKKSQTGGS